MRKIKPFFNFSLFILLMEFASILVLSTRFEWVELPYPFRNISLLLVGFWFCGCVFLLFLKENRKNAIARLLAICSSVLSGILLLFCCTLLLVRCYPDNDDFSADTTLFQQKNVMIVIPHQDDDINLAGGLIEQYTAAGSEVTVVFSTNGDRYGDAGIRAAEAVAVLTNLGVKNENIYYLGFGDQWAPQTFDGAEILHIYNSPDPDALWTSLYGATETYGYDTIPCYQTLPYTRNSYVSSLQSIISEKQPDTIFAVDFDSHIDHKGTDLFFEEALCNVLTAQPDYHPTVYKGFCYGTAWNAVDDYADSMNLLSSIQPDPATWTSSAYGYSWDNRVRFPMGETNLNRFLTNTSVFRSLDRYRSQRAALQATRILNGDKVFWERRTDSLLYGAEILAGGLETTLLNDFKLKDFAAIAYTGTGNTGIVPLYGGTVSIALHDTVTVNSLYLYDHPDLYANILEGFVRFSDGSIVQFHELNKDGSATILSFEDKQTDRMEIVITKTDSDHAGFTEIEAYCDVPVPQYDSDTFLMAVDPEDHFIYDYILHDSDTVKLHIARFPAREVLGEADLTVTLDGKDAACRWEDDALIVTCPKGSDCTITVSDGTSETTFTVSNPGNAAYAYLQTLRFVESMHLHLRILSSATKDYLGYLVNTYLPIL